MPLIDLAASAPDAVARMTIQQLVSNAGNGQLKDNSECQSEIREFLQSVDAEKLEEYSRYCLDHSTFTDGGFALQDVVNEMGRRLGFKVTSGRYRGVRNENGFDGIWHSPFIGSLVVETKTTAAYTINLETIANYRNGLIEEGLIQRDSSILFVVGRQDTLALEQQVRGSQHAWTMRIVGIDALLKTLKINVSSVSEEVTEQIHAMFKPIEYTRIDPIINVVFTATEDKEESKDIENEPDGFVEDEEQATSRSEALRLQQAKRQQIADAFGLLHNTKLVKRKTALFSSPDETVRTAISVSKRYDLTNQNYWYAYLHPMRVFLGGGELSFMIFGCMDRNEAFAIPYEKMELLCAKLNSTPAKNNREEYWHVLLKDSGDSVSLYSTKTSSEISLRDYQFTLGETD